MEMMFKRSARRCLIWVCAALFVGFTGCGGGRISCFVGQEPAQETVVVSGSPAGIHYFFDRTESLRGFTVKGDESPFVNVIDSIWKAGKHIYPDSAVSYYEYGEWTPMNKISETEVQSAKLSSFYTPGRAPKGTFVTAGTGQPFATVSAYIKTRLNANSLYVILTDLYEQGQQENVFVAFYRTMFGNGLSGAIFAAESDFTGRVYDYSPTDSKAFIDVPPNGKSMFFILVAGGGNEVAAYSGRLFKEFSDKELTVKYWLFTNGFEGNPAPLMRGNPKMAQNERRFGAKEYETEMVNLRSPKQASEIGLYQWEKEADVPKRVSAQVQAYRLQTDIGSRYAAAIPASAIQDDFDFDVQLNIAHSAGEMGKPVPGNLTPFKPSEPFGFKAGSFQTEELPLGLKIESTKNKSLRAGVYKVDYRIDQKAKVPDWILERNAANVADLKTSLLEGTPKVLSLKKVFEDIADIYNKIAGRTVSSGSIYFVKLK